MNYFPFLVVVPVETIPNALLSKNCNIKKLMIDNKKEKETGLPYKSGFFHSVQAESVFFFVILNSGMVQQRKEPPDLMISLISTSMTSYPRSRS